MINFRMNMPIYLMALYGSVMILIIIVLRKLLKDRMPKFVFPIFWTLVLIRLIIPFSLSSPISAPVPKFNLEMPDQYSSYAQYILPGTYDTSKTIKDIQIESSTNIAIASDSGYYFNSQLNMANILLIIYLSGVIITASILLYQRHNYYKNLKDSFLVEHNETINEILRSMSIGHILVFTNDHIASPLVSGILNPRIYLPSGMNFDDRQLLGNIFSHEAMHIKRKDNLTKIFMLIAICLHWYNPLVWIMSKCLSSDIETACDVAVLDKRTEDERKDYARSLLSMAITGNRSSLLYSAFSKTEVEKRIRNVLNYKRASAFIIMISVVLLFCSTVVFATGGQAPFENYLSSFCKSSSSKWGVEAVITRDVNLGERAQKRADNVIFYCLDDDKTNDPDILKDKIATSLAKEFGVEKNAFKAEIILCLDDETKESEYKTHGITKDRNGFYLFNKEPVRCYVDEMLGSIQTKDSGTVDIEITRDRLGNITSVKAIRSGDSVFDKRTKDFERNTNNSSSIVIEDIEY